MSPAGRRASIRLSGPVMLPFPQARKIDRSGDVVSQSSGGMSKSSDPRLTPERVEQAFTQARLRLRGNADQPVPLGLVGRI